MNYLFFKVGGRRSYVFFDRNFLVFRIQPEDERTRGLGYDEQEWDYAQSVVDEYAAKRAKELLMK